MLSYIRDNLKMKSKKKKIKNQKKSLKDTKELVSIKKTQGNKNILSYQKKYLTMNKSRVPMSSPSPSLNLMGKPMFGGRPMKKTKNGTQSMSVSFMTKLNEIVREIMKTIKEKLPEIRNTDWIEQKLITFIQDINGPSDILRKIKELPNLFNTSKSKVDTEKIKDCVDNCDQFLEELKKNENDWNKTYSVLSRRYTKKKMFRKKNDEELKNKLEECNQQFQEKKKFCPENEQNEGTIKNYQPLKSNIIKYTSKKNIIKRGDSERNESIVNWDNSDVNKQLIIKEDNNLTGEQKKKIIDIIKKKLTSLMTSMLGANTTTQIGNKLAQLNPISKLKEYFQQFRDFIDGFQGKSNESKFYSIDDDFIILNQQRLGICKCLKNRGIRVDHGLLNYINTNTGDLTGKIRDITYDYKIGQIQFDESNVYWIPLEVGSKNNISVNGGGTKKKTFKKKFNGGNTIMWQILFPVYDKDTPCEVPEEKGPKRAPPPPLNVMGKPMSGGRPNRTQQNSAIENHADNLTFAIEVGTEAGKNLSKGVLMADKMVDKFKKKLPFDFKKKEESKARNDFPGQKLKLSGALLQDSAKTIITLFITLVKMMEKNTHFKFVYYFAINTIYKFIRSLKEIARYSKSAAVPGNKKAAKYLVYLGKLVCINTENLLNVDLLRYVTGKISLALNFYQLDALQDINNLFESVISKMFNFNTEFCRYTSKLELKLAQESLSEDSSEGQESSRKPEEGKENNQDVQESETTPQVENDEQKKEEEGEEKGTGGEENETGGEENGTKEEEKGENGEKEEKGENGENGEKEEELKKKT